jgi:hypothetical protein
MCGFSEAFLERTHEQVDVSPVPTESLAVDEKRRCAVDPASRATQHIRLDAITITSLVEISSKTLGIHPEVISVSLEVIGGKRVLVFIEAIVHLPELTRLSGGHSLGCFGGGFSVSMQLPEREVPEHEPKVLAKALLNLLNDRVGPSTV